MLDIAGMVVMVRARISRIRNYNCGLFEQMVVGNSAESYYM